MANINTLNIQENMKKAHISVAIPVYRAEDCLDELYLRLKIALESICTEFEIVLVEDCGG